MSSVGDVVEHYVFLSALIFTIGGVGFLVRRNVLVQLMSIELMLNSVNLLLVAFNRVHAETMTGHSGHTAPALPLDLVGELMRRYRPEPAAP